MNIQQLIDMLKHREEGMLENIREAARRGQEESRIHYVGWFRGIQGSRMLVEHLRRRDAENRAADSLEAKEECPTDKRLEGVPEDET